MPSWIIGLVLGGLVLGGLIIAISTQINEKAEPLLRSLPLHGVY